MRSPHLTPTDEELVARALAGEGEAFGQLFDRHVRLVRATLMGGVRDEATLQDLSQETFVRAYRKLSHLRETEQNSNRGS